MERDETRARPAAGEDRGGQHPPRGAGAGFVRFLRDEQTHFFLLTVVVGACAAAVALIAHGLTLAVTVGAYHAGSARLLTAVQRAPWYLRLLVPAAGAVVAGALVHIAARRGGGGGASVSAVLEAVTLRHGFLSFRRTVLSALGSVLALGSGVSVGREGAIIGTSAAIGSRLGRTLKLTDTRLRLLVAAGTAAGFAAAYNTPIAATLFVLEVVAGSFATDLIGPTVIAAVVGTLVGRAHLWQGPLYEVPQFALRTPEEILSYAALGVLAGVGAALLLGSMRLGEAAFRRLAWPRWARAGLGGLIVGVIALRLPQVCGNGYETLADILNARVGLVTLALLLVAKTAATSASVNSGVPGGMFTPTLFIGAALGGLAGNLVHGLLPHATGAASSYALVGMGALLAATIRGPITATVLVAELTGDYVVVVPQLLACALAVWLTSRIDSVYAHELRRRGIHWEGTLEQKIVHSVRARDLLRNDVSVVPPGAPFKDVVHLFTTTRAACLYVVDGELQLSGIIELHAVKEFLAAAELDRVVIAQDLAVPARPVFADTPLAAVNERLWFLDTGEVPVVESGARGRFLGAVTQRDLLGFLDREILQRNLLLGEVHWRNGMEQAASYVELPEGYRLETLGVPATLAGKTVAEAQLRSRHGLNVLAIVRVDRRGAESHLPPAPDQRLRGGDHLVAVGPAAELDAFAKLR
jgi:chloride channel protein, CIC family